MFRTFLMTAATAAFVAAGVVATTGPALALTSDEVISELQAQGYTSIEVKVGPTQIKAEASNGTDRLEVVYDKETGNVLKSEVYAGQGLDVSPGIEVERGSRDFVGGGSDDDDDDDGDDDDDDDNSGKGSGGDRDDDNSGHGGGDDRDDDKGGDRGDD
ncbi:MAG: PepSY domain-containing protein [Rhodobacteraceae bacterium]|nr:PepSY domain-containing protein [Paracoccaceae bacterium]